jgi:hypothetical protein
MATLGLALSALTAVELAVRDDKEIDAGILGSFNAGISHLLLSGREPGSVELQALQNLAAGIVPDVEAATAEGDPGDKRLVESVPQPEASGGEPQGEAGVGEDTPAEPPSGTDGNAADEGEDQSADAEPPQLTETLSPPILPPEESANASTNSELFQPQVDEEDGA